MRTRVERMAMRKMRQEQSPNTRVRRSLGALGRAVVIALLAGGWAAGAGAEPSTTDLARDLAEVESRVREIELLKNVLLGLIGASALGLPALWWRLGKRISQVADMRIGSLIESRPGALLKIVEEHDRETKLRRESRIAIVSCGLELEAVLRQHGFLKVISQPPGAEVTALADAAAVIFDLTTIDEEQARHLIGRHGIEHALAYTLGRASLPNATFANSPITLFARLYELLKFQAARGRG
ncbi:MAG: hypothetical protein M3O15_06905 [Acidobacteriota bacterium]|nr:hypothetical protein [Acidobacteriota bacterium]